MESIVLSALSRLEPAIPFEFIVHAWFVVQDVAVMRNLPVASFDPNFAVE
ncbi:MAG TPA: hypothetical protein VMU62_01725 [Acidobacteriaceae bacterium]|nr:hypothetical protein [Acidobacteriaceae bacterium]